MEPEVPFNPFDPAHYRDPHERLAVLRQRCPVVSPMPGVSFVARDADVRRVLRDYTRFSNRGNFALDTTGGEEPRVVTQLDPPLHGAVRRMLLPAFTPDAVGRLSPYVREVVTELVERVRPDGRADLVAALAVPLPATVIAHVIGVPAADRAQFQAWTAEITANLPFNFRNVPAWAAFEEYLDGQVAAARARAEPQDDLIGLLVGAEVDGTPLSAEEIRLSVFQLIVAGFETTTHLIGNCLYRLLARPELWARVEQDGDLVAAAVEESLRLDPPIEWAMRTVAADTWIADVPVAPGERVLVGLASANRDEQVWTAPDEFDLDRPGAEQHLAFGHGIHLCLGAHLARVEATTAIDVVRRSLPGLRLEPGFAYERCESPMLRGPVRLDVCWSRP